MDKQKKHNNLIQIISQQNNKIIGFEEKEKVHIKGIYHTGISIFIFNKKKNLMLQKRSLKKYHSSLQWTNTCCSHPDKNESYEDAAHRCLNYEMGFDCILKHKFSFTYNEILNNGLIENELDHVFVGSYNNSPNINSKEVENWRWISIKKLLYNISVYPNLYTIWLKIILKNYSDKLVINF